MPFRLPESRRYLCHNGLVPVINNFGFGPLRVARFFSDVGKKVIALVLFFIASAIAFACGEASEDTSKKRSTVSFGKGASDCVSDFRQA